MQDNNTIKTITALAVLIIMSGCATQTTRNGSNVFRSNTSPFCALVGAAVGGGSAAAAGLAYLPIGAVVVGGAIVGHMICSNNAEPAPQPVATASPPQPRAAEPVRDLDSDGDGVIDRLDRCPGTPAGVKVDANGCPDILLTLRGVNFKFDKSDIEPDSERILNQAVEALNESSSVAIRIVGHTDSVGTDAYNQSLSERRANAVRSYLISKRIAGARMTTEGAGESQPVASNDTDDGRYQNRRVELHVIRDAQ